MLKETSTFKGLALLGSAVALSTGNGHLFSADVSQAGVQMGGVIGALVPIFMGLWEALPDKFKPSK